MKTTDLCDKYGDQLHVAKPIGLRSFGGRSEFHGQIETVQCFEDNTFVRATLEKNATGKVLVVDGDGSSRCALLGDNIAGLHTIMAGLALSFLDIFVIHLPFPQSILALSLWEPALERAQRITWGQ